MNLPVAAILDFLLVLFIFFRWLLVLYQLLTKSITLVVGSFDFIAYLFVLFWAVSLLIGIVLAGVVK